jgi:hypothetical protein
MAKAARARKRKPRALEAPVAPAALSPEAGWSPRSAVFIGLSAVVMAVPLAVLGAAAGPYDDPKAWTLPILVMGTAIAWLVRAPARPVDGGLVPDRPTRLLWWTAAGYGAWWAITTATSIAPGQSLLGSFGRGMGLLTVASAILLFFLVQSECRSAEAVRALIDATVLGSAPVCALALGQVLGWDPFPRGWDPATADLRVRSTLGQHIFLGSYLAIVVPLTAARLWSLTHSRRLIDDGKEACEMPRGLLLSGIWIISTLGIVGLASQWSWLWWILLLWGVLGAVVWSTLSGPPAQETRHRSVAVTLVAALLGLQAIVLVVCGARGPLLGVLFGLSVTGLGLFAWRRAFKPLAVSAAVVGGIIAVLVLLNLTRFPAAPLEKLPALQRLSDLGNLSYGSPGWFRLQVWSGIVSGWGRQLLGQEVIPDTSPWARDLLGYGLETQLVTLDRLALPSLGYLEALGREWRGSYMVDRAHNVLLDHLVTGGLIGVMWWLTVVGSLLLVAVSRLRSAGTGEETSVRLGCLGAVLAHLAEAQVGIVTTAPLALFWMTAAVLASPSWARSSTRSAGGVVGAPRPRRSWWTAAVVAAGLAAALAVWLDTRWLLASIAYARGARGYMAGRTAEAHADFRRSMDLAPWHALPAEAFASTALKLAGGETDSTRRLDLLHDGDAALAQARRHGLASAASWTLTAQLTFAESRTGERSKLPQSLEAFAAAARLRPQDADLMAQWGWAWLEGGDPKRAREAAERAVAVSGGRPGWLAWAVLARSARELGDGDKAAGAADMATRAIPPEARHLLKAFIP